MTGAGDKQSHDWHKTLPIIIACVAVCVSAASAVFAYLSTRNSGRSADASEKSSIASTRSADVSERAFRFQQDQSAPHIWFELVAQTNPESLSLQIVNTGAPVSVISWGFVVRRAEPPANTTYKTIEDAVIAKMFVDKRTLTLVRSPSPMAGLPKLLERNGCLIVPIAASDLRSISIEDRQKICAIGFTLSNGEHHVSLNASAEAFFRAAMPNDYVPLDIRDIKASFVEPAQHPSPTSPRP